MLGDTAAFVCQSPICRDTHFYTGNGTSTGGKRLLVSIPYMSGHPFLLVILNSLLKNIESVNPLYVGTPISTLTLKIA